MIKTLSGVVQEVADVIGRERALYLIGKLPRCYAGSEGKSSWRVIMYVPTLQKLKPDHRLVAILGWNDAVKLCRFFGGEILQPGNCAEIYRPFRDRKIAELASLGVGSADLAQWFDVSERLVRSIRAAIPQEEKKAANDNNQPVKKSMNRKRAR